MTSWSVNSHERPAVIRRGVRLEGATLAWNVAGVMVLAWCALRARSVALAGFGLDSLIEILASIVVVWELRGDDLERSRRSLRLIGVSFAVVALYLLVQGVVVLASHYHAGNSDLGLVWTGLTAIVMLWLSQKKGHAGRELDNAVLTSEARVTFIDSVLAASVFLGVGLHALFGWWWADPLAGFVLVVYALHECRTIFATNR
jgi:divalent metal cation (Fe/Co/Zn/Cd) transporter